MAPFISKASTACWRSCRLFLVWKLMHWWVSWGRCWNAVPTPSSLMPVAQQLPSRLRQCGAKSARRAPTWNPSTLSGCGRRRSLARLLACVRVGSMPLLMAGSPAGASSKGQLLSHSSLSRGGRRPQAIKDWSSRSRLPGWRHFRAGLDFTLLLGESNRRAIHPVGLPDGEHSVLKDLGLRTQHMGSLKRCSSHCRQDLRLEPEVLQQSITAKQLKIRRGRKACWHHWYLASWIMASFSSEVLSVRPWEKVLRLQMPPWSQRERRRLLTSWPTPQCLSTSDGTSGTMKAPWYRWSRCHLEVLARTEHHDGPWDGVRMPNYTNLGVW